MGEQLSIGARLKRERDKKNFSVEDVHLRLRIHPSVIERLEKDDLADWPGGKIYARGFVKQYAEFLGLNASEVLMEFDSLGIAERPVELFVGLEKKTQGETQPAETARPKPRRPRPEKKREPEITVQPQPDLISHLPPSGTTPPVFRVPARWLVAAGFIILLVYAIVVVAAAARDWMENRPSLKVAVMAPVEKKSEAQRQAAQQAAKPASKASAPATKPAAVPAPPSAPSKYLNSPAQANYPKIRPQDRMMLEIHAVTDVWMRIVSDSQVVFEAILHRGETERWLADKSFDAKLGRPEGVRVAVNGYPVGQPGAGKIKNLRFTRDGIEEIKG